MKEVSTIGLDLAKSVFQVHGADDVGKIVVRRQTALFLLAIIPPNVNSIRQVLSGIPANGELGDVPVDVEKLR